jgi:hypothetical protein
MSYNITKDKQILIEGVEYIQGLFPFYDKNKLRDNYLDRDYSIQMILESMERLMSHTDIEIFRIFIFDCLIGNTDRHHSNWAIMVNPYENENNDVDFWWELSPLYDNGSALCSRIDSNDVNLILKDRMRFEALINTKSTSAIGWGNTRPIRHFDLLVQLNESFYDETVEYVKKINKNITEQTIDELLKKFDDNIMHSEIKKLIKIFLLERKDRMAKIYKLNGVNGNGK